MVRRTSDTKWPRLTLLQEKKQLNVLHLTPNLQEGMNDFVFAVSSDSKTLNMERLRWSGNTRDSSTKSAITVNRYLVLTLACKTVQICITENQMEIRHNAFVVASS